MRKRLKCVKVLMGIMVCLMMFVGVMPLKAYAANYAVTGNVSKLTFSGNTQTTEGQDYVASISMNGGCQLPRSITVTVGGVPLSAGASTYTYTPSNGSIVIKSEALTGNVVISAAATEHQFGSNYVIDYAPSCTNQGSQSVRCQVCGITTGAQGIASTGHKFVNYVSNGDATCSKDGTKTAVCSNEGCSVTNTITDSGSKLSHTSTGVRVNVKEATCLEEGYTGDLLCTCKAVVKRGEVVAKLEHYGVVINAISAGCNTKGYSGDTICSMCGTEMKKGTEVSPIGEHSYGEWTVALEATTLKIGTRERVCTVCGSKETELIAASKWGEYIIPICIGVLILIGTIGVGCGIYQAVKRFRYVPNPLDNLPKENADEAFIEKELVEPSNETGVIGSDNI